LTQSRAGQNAAIKVNGLDISSASNTVKDVINGVTLNLNNSDTGATKALTIAHDTASLKTAVSNFVADYNAMKNVLDEYGGENGDLNGDSMVRGLKSQLRSLTSMPVDQLSGSYNSLTSVGIEFDSDGNLSLNESVLDAVMSSSYSSIGALFVAKGEPSDSQVNFDELSDDTKAGSYAVNLTALATKAAVTVGATVGSLTVDSTSDTLFVKVDGVLSQGITLTSKTYSSGSELAAEIQSKINGDDSLQEYDVDVSVTYNGSSFEITSNRYGAASGVEIVAVDGEGGSGAIGLQVEAEVNGIDVAGTINGEAATGSGQYLTSSSGDSADLKLRISGGVTGDRGTVSVSRGVADQLSSFIGNYIDTDGMIEGREDTLNDKLESYTLQSEKLDAKYESLLARYRSQFSILNGLLGSLDQQRDWMTATFENM
jgi:flagellar hook-associated protein 2